jgi:hypothetical protein
MTIFNILLMAAAELFGNINIKKFTDGNKRHNLIYGFAAYAAVIFFLIKCFASKNMMWTICMSQAMVIVISTLFAYFILGERFTNSVQYIGIVLALLAIACINYNPCKQ